ncbi:MAG: hypothetical protein ACI83W_001492 [Marinoscillum sp.]|jgi:hypothetical protein
MHVFLIYIVLELGFGADFLVIERMLFRNRFLADAKTSVEQYAL